MNNNSKRVTLIKLGGGLIAPKDWLPQTADLVTIKRLTGEIRQAKKRVVVAVGSGNYGHMAAKKYGITNVGGVKKVREIARKIGEIVAGEIDNSVLLEPHNIWCRGTDKSEIITQGLESGKTPVIYGDVIEEFPGKWRIYSGEECIERMLPKLTGDGWRVDRVIQVSRENGVWDKNGKVISEINNRNWILVQKQVGGARGVDMTGGMVHKVFKSLVIASIYDIYTIIICGKVGGRLAKALKGQKVPGTVVRNRVLAGRGQV